MKWCYAVIEYRIEGKPDCLGVIELHYDEVDPTNTEKWGWCEADVVGDVDGGGVTATLEMMLNDTRGKDPILWVECTDAVVDGFGFKDYPTFGWIV